MPSCGQSANLLIVCGVLPAHGHGLTVARPHRLSVDGDVLTIDVQKSEGQEGEEEQDGVKCVPHHLLLSIAYGCGGSNAGSQQEWSACS